MDYARQQRDPTKHAIGIVFVVAVHVLVVYALLTGLARKAVEVIKKPLSATIIEEIKAAAAAAAPAAAEADRRAAEGGAGDLRAAAGHSGPDPADGAGHHRTHHSHASAGALRGRSARSSRRPRPSAPPKPAIRKDPTRKSGDDLVYPRAAIRAGVSKGRVVARVMIDEKGNVYDVIIQSSDPPRVFDRTVIDGVKEWKYAAEGEKYVAEIEVVFVLKE